MPTRDVAALCARTCTWYRCTGTGSTHRLAHRCKVGPDVALDLGVCWIEGCDEPARHLLPRGRLCVGHTPPQPTTGSCAPRRCYCGRCDL